MIKSAEVGEIPHLYISCINRSSENIKGSVRNLVIFNENKRCNPNGQEKHRFIYSFLFNVLKIGKVVGLHSSN